MITGQSVHRSPSMNVVIPGHRLHLTDTLRLIDSMARTEMMTEQSLIYDGEIRRVPALSPMFLLV